MESRSSRSENHKPTGSSSNWDSHSHIDTMFSHSWDSPWMGQLLDQLSEHVALLNPEGVILEANQSLLQSCRLEREQIQGHRFWELR